MVCKKGRKISDGTVYGKIFYFSEEKSANQNIQKLMSEESEKSNRLHSDRQSCELEHFYTARQNAVSELKSLADKLRLEDQNEQRETILDSYLMLLMDPYYEKKVKFYIETENKCAETAISYAGQFYIEMFEDMDDDFFRSRADDIRNITDHLLANLLHENATDIFQEEPFILITRNMSPARFMQLDRCKILAFVSERESIHSHLAVLLRAMNIPALTGIKIREEWNGQTGVVDCEKECLYINPDPELRDMFRYKKEISTSMKGDARVTGVMNSIKDLERVSGSSVQGIGLIRTEFLAYENPTFFEEEQQYLIYKHILSAMKGKRVVIRLFDFKEDKAPLQNLSNMDYEEILHTQLRALWRAGTAGNLAILYPMINSCEEYRHIKDVSKSVRLELEQQGITTGNVEEGIMIETPDGAMLSNLLAKETDFISIGTNDLTQYTLETDRFDPDSESDFNPEHPSVLQLIRIITENAHKAGIRVSVCGESTGNPAMQKIYMEIGIDELVIS